MNIRKRTRITPITMATVLLAGGAAAVTTGSAVAAEPQKSATAQAACLDTARNFTSAPGSSNGNAHWPGKGKWAYTTGNCQDINLKLAKTREVRTCFKATGKCNAPRTIPAGKWRLAAKDVKDPSGFYIQFTGAAKSTGKIAY